MRFLRLDLKAFGPFTEKILDFSNSQKGVHIVYGPNEAGKSAALRALSSFLFGIHPRSSDNFLHDYKDLTIGARLLHSDGSQKDFFRRKGKTNTLLDHKQNPIPESELKRFLGDVSREVFEQMHGLNSETLIAGGKSLVYGQGEIGTSLLSAATGIPEIRDIIKSIQYKAEELFKPRGGDKQILNRLIREFDEHRKIRRELTLNVRDWVDLNDKIKNKQIDSEELKGKIRDKNTLLQQKKRQAEVMKEAREFREVERQLKEMVDVTRLPEDFTAKRIKAEEEAAKAHAHFAEKSQELKTVEHDINSLQVPETLLQLQDRIKELFQESGNFKQGQGQLPRLKGNLLEIERNGERLLRELGIKDKTNDLAKYCLTVQDHTRITELGEEFTSLSSELKHHRVTLKTSARKIDQLKKKIKALPAAREVITLQQFLQECRQSGLTEKRLKNLNTTVSSLTTQTANELKRLQLQNMNQEDVLGLPVPGRKIVRKFAAGFKEVKQRRKEVQKQLKSGKEKLDEIEYRIQEFQRNIALPTEDDLLLGRQQRDSTWKIIKTLWLEKQDLKEIDQGNQFFDEKSLAENHETSVAQTDEISDRLRRESERVAELSQLETRKELGKKEYLELQKEGESLDVKTTDLENRWQELWATVKIKPEHPEEMETWLDDYNDLLNQCRELVQKKSELQQELEEITTIKNKLSSLINEAGGDKFSSDETLESLCLEADSLIKQQNELKLKRQQLSAQIEEAENLAEIEKQIIQQQEQGLSEWKTNWEKAVNLAHMSKDVTPTQAKTVLEKFAALAGCVRDLEERNSRIRAIESDGTRFQQNIEKLSVDLSRSVKNQEYVSFIEQSDRELKDGLQKKERLINLQQKKKELRTIISKEEGSIQKNRDILKNLCQMAECEEVIELPGKEEQANKLRAIQTRMNELKQIISRSRGEMNFEEFLQELDQIDSDSLPSDLLEAEREIKQLEDVRTEQDQEIGALKKEKERMGSGKEAAETAEQIEHILAEMREQAEEYTKLMMSASAINEAVERYREEHQGPVVGRAAELFRRLTLNSFDDLTIGYGEDDKPILVGIRNGKKIQLPAMSEGTCDQLYLALRIASLEQHLENNESLPLILDDVLINFDDARAGEMLKIFAELSQKIQVILFTHHQHICDLAARNLGKDDLFTQEMTWT